MPDTLQPYFIVSEDGRELYPPPISKRLLCLYGDFTPEYIEEEIAAGKLRATIFSDDDIRISWPDLEDWLAGKENRPPIKNPRRPKNPGPLAGGRFRLR